MTSPILVLKSMLKLVLVLVLLLTDGNGSGNSVSVHAFMSPQIRSNNSNKNYNCYNNYNHPLVDSMMKFMTINSKSFKQQIALALAPSPLQFQSQSYSQSYSQSSFSSNPSPSTSSRSTQLYATVPTLDNWEVTRNGGATGRVSNHPNPDIFDGEMVTTSPLKLKKVQMKEGLTINTASGSKYKLGKPKFALVSSSSADKKNGKRQSQTNGKNNSNSNSNKNNKTKSSPSITFGGIFNSKKSKSTPIMNEWTLSSRNELIGVVSQHPNKNIADGDTLTTSKLLESTKYNRKNMKEGDVITTSSGSQYVLGNKKKGGFFNSGSSGGGSGGGSSAEGNGKTFKSGTGAGSSSPSSSSSKKSSYSNPLGTFRMISDALSNMSSSSSSLSSSPSSSTATSPSPSSASASASATATGVSSKQKLRNLKKQYGINGKTIASGKYLLCDRARRSTSGKSNIWSAYKADRNGDPIGEKLTIKVSTNFESMRREDNNYNKVCTGLFPGRFVDKSEFLEVLDGYPLKEFETSCALVIENGKQDLRAILNERGGRGFEGKAMRDAASAALQCIQAMHSSGIVWTDLKTENFVIVSDEIGDNGMLPGVKGIDLESAIPRGKNPVDFSPEACPPEFAIAFISGQGLTFKLDYSYDIWSYGMMLYELTTGRPYFDGKTPAQITMSLQYEFEPDLSSVSDDKLRDLIRNCLKYDPNKRPSVTQLLLHPYFLSSSLGPFGW